MTITYQDHYYKHGFWFKSLHQWAIITDRWVINHHYFY